MINWKAVKVDLEAWKTFIYRLHAFRNGHVDMGAFGENGEVILFDVKRDKYIVDL